MKNYLLILALLIAGCGNQHPKSVATTQSIETRQLNSTADNIIEKNDIAELQDSTNNITGGLNAIRFRNWNQKDWRDNDYFRALRKYIDACYKGEIENQDLEPYKSALKGKFVIGNAEPFIMGGMFISIVFLDMPNKIFDTRVYSEVDEELEKITKYEVRGIHVRQDEESGWTKEEILAIIKEHPEHKLW